MCTIPEYYVNVKHYSGLYSIFLGLALDYLGFHRLVFSGVQHHSAARALDMAYSSYMARLCRVTILILTT